MLIGSESFSFSLEMGRKSITVSTTSSLLPGDLWNRVTLVAPLPAMKEVTMKCLGSMISNKKWGWNFLSIGAVETALQAHILVDKVSWQSQGMGVNISVLSN